MEFRQYQTGDLEYLVKDEGLKLIVTDKHVDYNLSWTLVDEKILASGGFAKMWPGVYEAWLYVTAYPIFLRYRLCLIKKIRAEIVKLDFYRLQAAVDVYTKNHSKFMRLLGFHPEGIMERFGLNRHDHVMYARLK